MDGINLDHYLCMSLQKLTKSSVQVFSEIQDLNRSFIIFSEDLKTMECDWFNLDFSQLESKSSLSDFIFKNSSDCKKK